MDQLAAVLLGGLLSLVGILGVAISAERARANRDQRLDELRIRDSTRERLRPDYAKLLEATWALATVADESRFLVGDEDEKARDKRLAKVLSKVLADIDSARVRLVLEKDATDVLNAFSKAYSGYVSDRLNRNMNKEYPGTVPLEEVRKARKEIGDAAQALEDAAKKDLERLSKPVPVSDSPLGLIASRGLSIEHASRLLGFLALGFAVSFPWAVATCTAYTGLQTPGCTTTILGAFSEPTIDGFPWGYLYVGGTLVAALSFVMENPLRRAAELTGIALIAVAGLFGLGWLRQMYWLTLPPAPVQLSYQPIAGFWLALIGLLLLSAGFVIAELRRAAAKTAAPRAGR